MDLHETTWWVVVMGHFHPLLRQTITADRCLLLITGNYYEKQMCLSHPIVIADSRTTTWEFTLVCWTRTTNILHNLLSTLKKVIIIKMIIWRRILVIKRRKIIIINCKHTHLLAQPIVIHYGTSYTARTHLRFNAHNIACNSALPFHLSLTRSCSVCL